MFMIYIITTRRNVVVMLSQKTELEGECKQVISPHWSCTKNMHEFRNVLLKMVAKAKALQGINSLHS